MAIIKVQDWLEEDKLLLLEGWSREGLTEEQISKNMGISVKTLYNWKKDNLPILQALKKGREVVDFEVENALLKNALDGNVTAQIFWLKNRKAKDWKDRVETPIDTSKLDKVSELLNKIEEEAKK